jgi:hypothetical protein
MCPAQSTDPRPPTSKGYWTDYLNLRREPWFLHRRIALLGLLAVIVPCLALSFHTPDGTRTLLRVVAIGAFLLFVIVGITIRRRYSSATASGSS